jgi:hypothetical protein
LDPTYRPVSSLIIPDDGLNVHMMKFGFVWVFHTGEWERVVLGYKFYHRGPSEPKKSPVNLLID